MKLIVVHDKGRWIQAQLESAEAELKRLNPILVPDEFKFIRRFDTGISLEAQGAKSFTAIKSDTGVICDYQDVSIKGYLSTFVGTTLGDREGDYVEPGAFTETIKSFLANNPVMLRDHINMTDYLSGSFTTMREDQRGLYVEGKLSNAPGVQDTRYKVAEGILKTLSMGGLFHYKPDGRGIFKVDLFEGSLTPVPMNPDAIITVRALTDLEREYVKEQKSFRSYSHFLQAKRLLQNRTGLAA